MSEQSNDMNENENVESNGDMDFGQMEKMLSMVKMVKGLAESGMFNNLMPQNNREESNAVSEPTAKNEVKSYAIPFDEDLQTPTIKTIKAAIPYLESKYQRNMGMLVKLIEIDRLIKKYSDMEVSGQSLDGDKREKMMGAIRQQLDFKNQQMMDMFFKIIEIKKIVEVLENGKQKY